jgi:hypothetical protein
MAGKKGNEQDRIIELLEKILLFQLYSLGVNQERIAKTVGKNTVWVNTLVKGIPRVSGGKE